MKDTKMIEEMALIICGFKDCTSCISRMGLRKCGAKVYAERLYNADYRKQSEWISVEDRLPEKDGKYLVYDVGQHLGISIPEIRTTFFKRGDRYHDYMWRNHFSHWMPLPEPPKKKGGANDANGERTD